MYPDLFGINNFSYTLCMILGIIAAFLIVAFYIKRKGITKAGIIDMLICACFAVASGIVFSILFENLYEWIEIGKSYKFQWGKMTFFGGLAGGVAGFLITYYLMRKNVNFDINHILIIAPVAITIAHSIGRIGCFLAGCCHGVETDSWIGIDFPYDGLGKVVPTQLIEAIFLFLLFIVLAFLALKKDFKYNFIVYAVGYGLFRFVIEFFRGDERGVAFALSPSQIWGIIAILGSIPLYFVIKYSFNKENGKK